jgi:hypothetical protein
VHTWETNGNVGATLTEPPQRQTTACSKAQAVSMQDHAHGVLRCLLASPAAAGCAAHRKVPHKPRNCGAANAVPVVAQQQQVALGGRAGVCWAGKGAARHKMAGPIADLPSISCLGHYSGWLSATATRHPLGHG